MYEKTAGKRRRTAEEDPDKKSVKKNRIVVLPTAERKGGTRPRGRQAGAIAKAQGKPGSKPQSKASNLEDEEMSDIPSTEASFIVEDEDSADDIKNYDPRKKSNYTEGAPSSGDDSEPEAEESDDSPPNSSPHDSELPATASPGSAGEESDKGNDSEDNGDDHPDSDEGPGSESEAEGEPVEEGGGSNEGEPVEEGGGSDDEKSVGGDTIRNSSPEPEDDEPDADPVAAPPAAAPAPAPAAPAPAPAPVPAPAPAPVQQQPAGARPICTGWAAFADRPCKNKARVGRTTCHHH